MRKIKLLLEYEGTNYLGWQIQKKGLTIQGTIEDRLLKITGEQLRVIGASRTDSGVHALGQVATFITKSNLDHETIKRALNALLPPDIRVLEASDVHSSFHPRKDATKKSYFYIITNQRDSSVFLYGYTWLIQQTLNLTFMKEASLALIGKHDFSSFKGTGSSIKDSDREISCLSIEIFNRIDFMTATLKGKFIKIRLEADGFLRHMVRNIIGTLVEIGRERIPAEKIKEILESLDRRKAGPTAPPNGLFLENITY
jgi:tRNA pseudouridine38-40 synthase